MLAMFPQNTLAGRAVYRVKATARFIANGARQSIPCRTRYLLIWEKAKLLGFGSDDEPEDRGDSADKGEYTRPSGNKLYTGFRSICEGDVVRACGQVDADVRRVRD